MKYPLLLVVLLVLNATLSPAQTPKLLEDINGILTAAIDATNLAATLELSNGLHWAIGN